MFDYHKKLYTTSNELIVMGQSGNKLVQTELVSFKTGVFKVTHFWSTQCKSLGLLHVPIATHLLYMDKIILYDSGQCDLHKRNGVVQEHIHGVGNSLG